MKRRRRFKQTSSLQDRLANEAKSCRAGAAELAPGRKRDALLKEAEQADAASEIDKWLSSPGLQPPSQPDTQLPE